MRSCKRHAGASRAVAASHAVEAGCARTVVGPVAFARAVAAVAMLATAGAVTTTTGITTTDSAAAVAPIATAAAAAAPDPGFFSASPPGAPARAPLAAPPAQPDRHLAGVVVDLGGGDVREACVDLDGAERNGMELLRQSGLDVVTEDDAVGTRVCRIAGTGCAFPVEPCWCRCQVLGADCTYWSYNTLSGGQWSYARLGPLARTVRHGDVDGWAWGRGSVTAGAQPPVRAFEAICAAALAPSPTIPPGTPVVTPAPTPGAGSPDPGPTTTGAPRSTPRSTLRPTARPTQARGRATATPGRSTPSAGGTAAGRATTPSSGATASGPPGPPATATLADPFAPVDPAGATADAVARATLAAFPTAWSALMTAVAGQPGAVAATSDLAAGLGGGAGSAAVADAAGADAAPSGSPMPPAATDGGSATLVPARAVTTAPAADEAEPSAAGRAGDPGGDVSGSAGRGQAGYVVFAAVAGLLLAALMRRRSS